MELSEKKYPKNPFPSKTKFMDPGSTKSFTSAAGMKPPTRRDLCRTVNYETTQNMVHAGI